MSDLSVHIFDLYTSRKPLRILPIGLEFNLIRITKTLLVGVRVSSLYVFDIETGKELLMREKHFNVIDVEDNLLAVLAFDHVNVWDMSVSPPAFYMSHIGHEVREMII